MRVTQWLIATACTAVLGLGMAAAQTPTIPKRQGMQKARIAHGVRSGELTPREARHLAKKQRRIHRSIVRDRRDGDGFTSRERIRAQRRLNQQSRAINRLKHNDRTR
jgi:hypothetical protein